MEPEMGSGEKNSPSKPTRKRPCRRSSQGHFIINLADANRDISSPPCVAEGDPVLQGKSTNCDINMPVFSDAQYCYSLLEAMPLPGPIWSTTSPSVMAEPPPSVSAPINNSVDFEWVENQDSSYSWWLGFLKSLDENVNAEDLNSQLLENFVMENSKILGHELAFVDGMDQNCCPDDWLMIPTVEKDLGDINIMP